MRLEKSDLRKFNKYYPNGDSVVFAWYEEDGSYVFQKEIQGKNYWDRTYGTIRVNNEDLANGNFEYFIKNNITRFN